MQKSSIILKENELKVIFNNNSNVDSNFQTVWVSRFFGVLYCVKLVFIWTPDAEFGISCLTALITASLSHSLSIPRPSRMLSLICGLQRQTSNDPSTSALTKLFCRCDRFDFLNNVQQSS